MRQEDNVRTDFHHHIPRDVRENIRWRAAVHKRVMDDPGYANVIREACSRDFLFWLSGFGWTYDPRPHVPFPKVPFIPYNFQEDAALEILWSMGVEDALIEKSRDMGASWLLVAIFVWMFLFHRDLSFLFVSRVENYVDQSGNPKSLFWKVDFLIENMPEWLRPRGYRRSEHRTKMHIENPETGSVIDGEATTGQVARGDRRTAILLDEFAAVEQGEQVLSSTRDATSCRMFNSTPAGTANAFYKVRQSQIKKIRMHWSQHPLKSKGLYTTDEEGGLEILDQDGWDQVVKEQTRRTSRFGSTVEKNDFEPILDGKVRSYWYDEQCKRVISEQEIAQELDIDYLGSGYQFFSQERISEAIEKHCVPPFIRGDLEYDNETCDPIKFVAHPQGPLELWCMLDGDGNPILDEKITIGCDISAGTGASNSAAAAWMNKTREKVAQYANPRIRPEQFAKFSVALAKWFNNAFLVWEANGVGRQFGARVLDQHYANIYYRPKKDGSMKREISDIPGWASTKEAKIVLLGAYRAAIESDQSINKSKDAMEETLEYVFAPDGSVVHSKSTNKQDPTGAKTNHGDRVIADALAVKGMGERKRTPVHQTPKIPVGSLAWRNQMREEMAMERSGFDSSSSRELGKEWG